MNSNQPLALIAVITVLAGLISGFVVHELMPRPTQIVQQVTGASPTGTTFNTAKTAMIVFAPTSNTASSTSILNGDANDRIIKQAQYDCTGATFTSTISLASVLFEAATTTIANEGLLGNGNLAMYSTMSTSSGNEAFAATSTQAASNRRWASGTYLTFSSNATSTGLSCTIGVDYFGT